MSKEHKVGDEVTVGEEKGVITEGYDQGWFVVKINGIEDNVFYDEINTEPRTIYPGMNGRIGGYRQNGSLSNSIIQQRNGGVRHQFQDSIGGCSSNYR